MPSKVPSPTKIYRLIDPRDNSVRYIGKTTKDIKSRFYQHSYVPDWSERWKWLKELEKAGLKAIIEVVEDGIPPGEADTRELHWIRHYQGQNAPLLNVSRVRTGNKYRGYHYDRDHYIKS